MNNYNFLYTSIKDAQIEVERRRNDRNLIKKIEKYIKNVPKIFKEEPRAVLSRPIVTPDMEFQRFIKLTKKVGLKPASFEYHQDTFHTINPDKLYLGKIVFCSKKNDNKYCSRKIIDFNKAEGKEISKIRTKRGIGLIKFHRKLLDLECQEIELYDGSSWYNSNGEYSAKYYTRFLALFVCHGVLFENFLLTGSEKKLTEKIVIPAFNKVQEMFGFKPLIIELIPEKKINSIYWYSHK